MAGPLGSSLKQDGARRALWALAVLAALASLLAARPAGAAVQAVLYAAPAGSGSACTQAAPCSLTGARNKVRTLNDAMTGDVVVRLAGGTYHLAQPLRLDGGDSGTGGHRVVWEAAPAATPVFGAGVRLTGWQPDGGGIWSAPVPAGLWTRQLFVDGRRAVRARGMAGPGGWRKIDGGFRAPDDSLARWAQAGEITDAELVGVYAWKQHRCPIASVSGRDVKLANPCWERAETMRDDEWDGTFNAVLRAEHAGFLLDEPGEWFLDRRNGRMRYMPRPGENLATAEVVAPAGELLVDARGTAGAPLHHVELRGLTFADTTWLGPSRPTGYPVVQAGLHWAGEPQLTKVPGAVRVGMAHDVIIDGNRFIRLGGAGLSVEAGSRQVQVTYNTVEDVSGTGIHVGEVVAFPAPERQVRGVRVADNRVLRAGRDYQDNVGIFVGYTVGVAIEHNEVADLPYTGISVGWGWGEPNYSANARVTGNHIHEVMQTLDDGGAIYVLGVKAASPPSVMEANYAHGVARNWAVLYLDNGSTYWQVHRNVVADTPTNWLLLQTWRTNALNNTVTGNWSDTDRQTNYHPSNVVAGNATGIDPKRGDGWPPEAEAVIAQAGPRPRSTPPTTPPPTTAAPAPTTTTLAATTTTTAGPVTPPDDDHDGGAGTGGDLPFTGSNAVVLLVTGLALLAGGAAMLVVRRRAG